MPVKSEFKCGIQWVCVALTPCLNTLSLHLVSYTLSKAKESAPQYHAPSLRLAGTASPHLCWRAFADASPALDDNRQRLASGRQTPNSMTISRPYRASRFWPITQGVALGWYVSPLQGLHKLWHKLLLLPNTEIRCNENAPAEPGAKPGRV